MSVKIFKKVISTAAAVSVLATALTSCDGLSGISLLKKEKNTEPESTQIVEDLSVWKDKYEEFLMGVINNTQTVTGYEFEVEDCMFDMVNIDKDDIPEILISEGSYPGSKVSIFSYDGYEVRHVGSVGSNGEAKFVENINIILSEEEYDDLSLFTAYSIEEYKLNQVWQGAISLENGETKYIVNDVEVSEDDYRVQYDLYQFNNVSSVGRNSYPLTAAYIMDVLESDEKPPLPETTTAEETSESETGEVLIDETDENTEDITSEAIDESTLYYEQTDYTQTTVLN